MCTTGRSIGESVSTSSIFVVLVPCTLRSAAYHMFEALFATLILVQLRTLGATILVVDHIPSFLHSWNTAIGIQTQTSSPSVSLPRSPGLVKKGRFLSSATPQKCAALHRAPP